MRLIDADKIPFVDLSDGKGKCFVAFADKINAMPTIEPEQKHGRWIPFEWNNDWTKRIQLPEGSESVWEEYWEEEFICSACGHVHYRRSFCPHCGARMDKGDES